MSVCVTCAVFVVSELGVSQKSDPFSQTEGLQGVQETLDQTATQLDRQAEDRRHEHS